MNSNIPLTENEAVENELTVEELKRKLRGAEDDLQRAKSRIEDLEAYRIFAGQLLRAAEEMPATDCDDYNLRYILRMAQLVLHERFDWLAPSYIPF